MRFTVSCEELALVIAIENSQGESHNSIQNKQMSMLVCVCMFNSSYQILEGLMDG